MRLEGTVRYLLLVVLAAATVGCGGGGSGSSADDAGQGLAEFRQTCAVCHGQSGEGMPRLGKELTNNEFVRGQSDEQLLAFLIEGRPASHPDNDRGVDMPPRGGNPAVTDAELMAIVSYMRSIQ